MLKLSSPWDIYAHKVNALFEPDEEVNVVFDNETMELKLYVDNGRKADAIAKLLPEEKEFGNVKIKITVIPSNKNETIMDTIKEAFANNEAVDDICSKKTPMGEFQYVIFAPRVVQFFSDDISDIDGKTSTLYQDIAKDVLGEKAINVYFCTTNQPFTYRHCF